MIYRQNTAADILVGYTDSDWAGDKNDRKSTSGYAHKRFGNTVSWLSQKQLTVSLSSTEAEKQIGYAVFKRTWSSLQYINNNIRGQSITYCGGRRFT